MGFPMPDTGSVTEDTGVVGGFLTTSGDADFGPFFNNDAGRWVAESLTGAYGGQLVIDSDGVWTYAIHNSNPTIQALNTGESITETFTVSARGMFGNPATTTITITINGQDEPPCFVAGSLLETARGDVAIETVKPGDLVRTRDNGLQEVRWIGTTEVAISEENADAMAPIRVAKDAFAPGVPERDILFSPTHRVLLYDWKVQNLFGEDEVLCPIGKLVNGRTIRREIADTVTYCHLLFDDHQIVTTSNCDSESFYPGQIGLEGFRDETREEVFNLFPDLRALPNSYGKSARRILKGKESILVRDRTNVVLPFIRDVA